MVSSFFVVSLRGALYPFMRLCGGLSEMSCTYMGVLLQELIKLHSTKALGQCFEFPVYLIAVVGAPAK